MVPSNLTSFIQLAENFMDLAGDCKNWIYSLNYSLYELLMTSGAISLFLILIGDVNNLI